MSPKDLFLLVFLICALWDAASAQDSRLQFSVIAFYTAEQDAAHISFVHEANKWFAAKGLENNYKYDSTSNWDNLNLRFLENYDVVLFLDTRPDDSLQRVHFRQYMEQGGAWIGFHFAGFALTPSAYPQNWDWYHEKFLGCGQYKSNTWRPTPARLKIEASHPVTKNLPSVITAAANEWYSWKNDLTKNDDIEILLSIDATSFPLGTGPKQHEIWHAGYYPVVWTNKHYRMIYFNMGHNDMDYGGTNKALSSTFSSDEQNQLIINGLLWLGRKSKK